MKKKYFKYLAYIVVIAIVITLSFERITNNSKYNDIIRLHIISSDLSNEAKTTKLLVRDEVLNWLKEQKINLLSPTEAATFISTKLNQIKEVANDTLKALGLSQNVSIQFGKTNLPAKMYLEKGFILPSGLYNSLNVRIGDAKGQNWWCVAYPTQCLNENTVLKINDSKKIVFKLKILEWLKQQDLNAYEVCKNALMFYQLP
ncbi:stage II sporulation protein R [Clostridium sp. 'deep sea']|uniref:stage II sporulation protein R n=1 Tax=Clostridium sp. 'deep sea' TaxID=2779445 RepID=UPI001896A53D|nr:stage II sporulation protein R [Clostridium sp. 'deep sea']QOR36210.1 stage II sporulation protein R [Clostridium sp. 'deep sea']